MKIAAYAVALFGFLLAALACFAPATLADGRLARLTEGRLRLADAEGTLWHGRGMLTEPRGTWRIPIAWRLAPGALATGRLVIDLVTDEAAAMPRGRFDAGASTLALADFRARIPAQALGAFSPQLDRAAFGGALSVASPAFAWRGEGSEGTLALRWTDARIASPVGLVQLGTVELPLAPRGDGVAGPLSAIGGDVRIDGTFVARGTGVTLDATLLPAPGAPAGLVRALAAIGTPGANGAIRVAWRSGAR